MSRSHSALVAAFLFSLLLAGAADAAIVRGTVSTTGGVRLSGKVVEAYDMSGVLRGSATTDATGSYTLAVAAGTYRLLAYDPEGTYATSFHPDRESFEQTVGVTVIEGSPVDVHFRLVLGGTISGTVTAMNAPLAGAVVELYNLSGTRRGFARTNAAGQFSLVAPIGEYKLFVYDPNDFYAGEFYANARAFAEAQNLRVLVGTTQSVVVALEPAAHVSGTVLDAQTRLGIAGMEVYAYTVFGALVATRTTDAQGLFRFSLPAGQYRLVTGDPRRVYGPSFWMESRSFAGAAVLELGTGDRRNVVLLAERGARITGSANTMGAYVTAYNLDGSVHARTFSNPFSDYSLIVAPGRYKVAVEPFSQYASQFYGGTPDFASAQVIAVIGGETLTLDFHPPRAGQFIGTVRDAATQQQLSGVIVAAYDAAGVRVAETRTVAGFTYTLRVAPGEYRVVAFDPRLEYAPSYAPAVLSVAVDQSVPLDFSMRRGTRVSGMVVVNGRGAEGVEVLAFDLAGNVVSGATTDADGRYTLVVVPGTYTFEARTPFTRATRGPIDVGAGSPAPVSFVLEGSSRRRTVRH